MIAFDFIVDISFGMDIILTFFTGYEKKDQTIETDKRVIAQQYLKMWFWIDCLSTFPVGIFELNFFQEYLTKKYKLADDVTDQRYIKLLRLARLPRLYRVVRILRVFKMLSFIRNNKQLKKFNDFLRLTPGITTIA
jgi:hypothetical protein